MFSRPRPNLIESDSGFSVEVLGRTGIEYREGDKAMYIDSEVLATRGIAIYADSIVSWKPPHDAALVTIDDKARIVANLRAVFEFLNDPATITDNGRQIF